MKSNFEKSETDTNLYKNMPHGFSWTYLIFGWAVPANRGGEKIAALLTFLFGFPLFALLHLGPVIARTVMVADSYEFGLAILLIGFATHLFVSFHYNEWSYKRKKNALRESSESYRILPKS